MPSDESILIVDEGDYLYAEHHVKQLANHLSECSAYYVKILRFILENSVQDQRIASGFEGILSKVESLPENVESILENAATHITEFTEKIDEADSFLY